MKYKRYNEISFEDALFFGILDSKVNLVTGYPGYPITKLFERIGQESKNSRISSQSVEWCINEKVAIEKALGASFAGARSLVIMKNHGTNTILDVLVNFSYTGVKGGTLIISGDDLAVKASQNESDSRLYGFVTKIPVIEPSTVDDAYRFVYHGYQLSEKYNTPVILRTTGTQLIQRDTLKRKYYSINDDMKKSNIYAFIKDNEKYFIGPKNYPHLKNNIIKRTAKLKTKAHNTLNEIVKGNKNIGIICSGDSYHNMRKNFLNATIFKVGLVYPLSKADLNRFFSYLSNPEKVYIFEQNEPLIEMQVKNYIYDKVSARPIEKNKRFSVVKIIGNDLLEKVTDRESVDYGNIILKGTIFNKDKSSNKKSKRAEMKKVKLCPACPARSILISLKMLDIKVMGDAGCTALGCLPPFESVHSGLCMGSSISIAAGVNKASQEKVIALIGDSAFFHSGLPGLLNEIEHSTDLFVIIFNNKSASMTGGQITIHGIQISPNSSKKIEKTLISSGIQKRNIRIIKNSTNLKVVKSAISHFYKKNKGVRVLIIEGECYYNFTDNVNYRDMRGDSFVTIHGEMIDPGCFAHEEQSQGIHHIYHSLCKGCTLCDELIKISPQNYESKTIKLKVE